LFEEKGLAGGASGMAAGLLHPYVGEEGRRSLRASEALMEAEALLAVAGGERLFTRGIERTARSLEQEALFLEHGKVYGDIEPLGEMRFLIRSGLTVDAPAYLQGLWEGIERRGGRMVKRRVEGPEELEEFDRVVIAAGAGSLAFTQEPLSLVKGQVLLCSPPLAERSWIGKGYIARVGQQCVVGSTYERGKVDTLPDESVALARLEPFFPRIRESNLLECRAALRVTRHGHYFPLMKRESERLFVLTGFGSRGLLYHALLGKELATEVL
jgi:glycine/D-amino acid oxidase-like deaminating enzyme